MKNNRGFTLVELLVAVAILGIITGMSIPVIRNVQYRNERRKYESYGESLVQSAKLYVDSYGEDLFGHKKTGCALIKYQQLEDKGLAKPYNEKNYSCNSDQTLVRVVKMDKQYGYSYQLYCGPAGADGKATSAEYIAPVDKNSNSKRVSEAMKHGEDDEEFEDYDDDGFNDNSCSYDTTMSIIAYPENGLNKAEEYHPKVKLESSTGINPGSSIQYAWVDVNEKSENPVIDYNTITDWKTATFSVDSKEKQLEELLSTSEPISSKQKELSTPKVAPAYYALVLKGDNFKDLEGEPWINQIDESQYKVLGVYNVGKNYTITYDNAGGTGCDTDQVLVEKGENRTWEDLCTPEKENFTFSGWKDKTTGQAVTSSTVVNRDLSVIANWTASGGGSTPTPTPTPTPTTRYIHFVYTIQPGHENGGTLTTQTTNGTWTLDSNRIINKNGSVWKYSYVAGTNVTIDLANYNNSKWLNITRNNSYAVNGKEWICSKGCNGSGGANQTFSMGKITIANTNSICNTSAGDCTVELKVNWRYETTGSARAYGYHFDSKTCTGTKPTRTYDAVFLQCECVRDAMTGDITNETTAKDITTSDHSDKKIAIHYKNSDNGRKACKSGPYNHYVNKVCTHYSAEAHPTVSYHGYMFYSGTGNWTQFAPTSTSGTYSWYHTGGQYNNRIDDCKNTAANRKRACVKACQAVYNRL